MKEFVPYLVQGLGLVATGVLLLLANTFRKWADARFRDGKYESAKDTVVGWIERTVDYFDQVIVDDLKRKAEDGDLTKEELKEELEKVKRDAIRSTKEKVGAALKEIAAHDGAAAAEAFVESALEAYINRKRGE